MKLYFLRHTEAGEGDVDATRRLTAKGRRDARKLGRYFRRTGVEWGLAFTSPLIRARETAEGVLKECPLPKKVKLVETESLLNDTSRSGFFKWLATLPEAETVLLVGHEPSLSAWVRHLLGVASAGALPLPKGGVARIDTDDRKLGMLRLLTSPKTLP